MPLILAAVLAVQTAGCARKPPPQIPPFNHHYTHWGIVLARCVTPDGFRYSVLKADPGPLAMQLAELERVTPAQFASFNRAERMAFLINAHNIHAVRRVAAAYPVKSIKRTSLLIPALRRSDIRLLGRDWSLLSLREEILGPSFGDSRALFVLNWGMRGCAPLAPSPLTPENLADMLEEQTRRFVRNPAYCRYDAYERRIEASPLILDHRELIERDYTTLWGFLRHFAALRDVPTITSAPPVFEWRKFDTMLNDADVLPAPPAPAAAGL